MHLDERDTGEYARKEWSRRVLRLRHTSWKIYGNGSQRDSIVALTRTVVISNTRNLGSSKMNISRDRTIETPRFASASLNFFYFYSLRGYGEQYRVLFDPYRFNTCRNFKEKISNIANYSYQFTKKPNKKPKGNLMLRITLVNLLRNRIPVTS